MDYAAAIYLVCRDALRASCKSPLLLDQLLRTRCSQEQHLAGRSVTVSTSIAAFCCRKAENAATYRPSARFHFEPSFVLQLQFGMALAAAREFVSQRPDSDKTVRTLRSTVSGRCQRGDCTRAKLYGNRERGYPEASLDFGS